MNWCEIQSSWPQLSGLLQSQWPTITADDLDAINGVRSALADTLKRNYALPDAAVEMSIAAFEKDCRHPGAVK